MADSDKNILITPNRGQASEPKIEFIGSSSVPITLKVLDDNSLSWEGTEGQLFSITNNLSSGTIFSVNDISGVPSIEVDANGTVVLAEFSGNVGIGTASPTHKLTVDGVLSASSTIFSTITSSTGLFEYGNTTYGMSTAITMELGKNDTTNAGALKIWGNTSSGYGLIQATTNNLHIDTFGGSTYINYYDGTDLIVGGNGVKAPNGVQTGPSYSFTNDTNTGMFLGTTDELAFATAGSERLRIDNAGLVGIGTTNPVTRLHLGAKVSADSSYSYDTNALYVVHQTPTSTTTLNDPKEVLLLGRQGTDGQAYGAAASFRLSRWENNGVNSRTRLDLVLADGFFLGGSTTVLTARSNGNIGIGTTNPAYTLDVNGTVSASIGLFTSITGSLQGNATTATTATQVSQTLTRGTYLTGNNYNGSAATTWAVDATSANTASKVVARDASGNFSAGTITANLSGNASTVTNGIYTTNISSYATTAVTAGTGLSGGGTVGSLTLNLDFSELTDKTSDIDGTTEFILQDGTTESRKAASEIKLSVFNNDSGWTSNTGTVTSIATNNGVTGGTITTTGTIGLTGQALALHNLATNGLITRTGAGTVTGRTIAGGTGITVTNGDGVSGNPSIALTNNSLTVGSTSISLGGTATTIAGLTSVTSTGFTGSLSGNASTVTNGVYIIGDQTIGGIKTFSSQIRTSTGTIATSPAFARTTDTDTGIFFPAADELAIATGGAEEIRIKADGKIGIGVSTPDSLLHVHNGSAGTVTAATNTVLTVENNNDSVINLLAPDANVGVVSFGFPTSNSRGAIAYSGPTFGGGPDRMSFLQSGSNTRMVIDGANGDVGIGISSPQAKLHIVHESGQSGITLTNNTGLVVENAGSANNSYVFQTSTTGGGRAFSVTNAGNVGIGTVSPGAKLEVNGNIKFTSTGQGIDFSANGNAAGMTSELLDDYEEGTWTATVVWGTTPGGTITSYYVKIGQLVYFEGGGSTAASATSTAGLVYVTGLPFNVANSTNPVPAKYVSAASRTGYVPTNSYITTAEEIVTSGRPYNGGSVTAALFNFTSGVSYIVEFAGCYRTTD